MITAKELGVLLSSHDQLRAAVIIAGKRIRKLQFGKANGDPVLKYLRDALYEARSVRKRHPRTVRG